MPEMTEHADHQHGTDPRDYAAEARRIGDAARDARRCLDDLDDVPWPQMDAFYYQQAAWAMDVVLRELLDAIDAVAAAERNVTLDRPLSDSEKEFIAASGLDSDVDSAAAHKRAEDWLVWSAITTNQHRERLDRLTEMTALDIIPGLREVVAAFPAELIDLDRFTVLRSPAEELGGMTPIQWLLLGGDPRTAAILVANLKYGP